MTGTWGQRQGWEPQESGMWEIYDFMLWRVMWAVLPLTTRKSTLGDVFFMKTGPDRCKWLSCRVGLINRQIETSWTLTEAVEAAEDEFIQAGRAERRVNRWTLKSPADLMRTGACHPPLHRSSALYHTSSFLTGLPTAGDTWKKWVLGLDAAEILNPANDVQVYSNNQCDQPYKLGMDASIYSNWLSQINKTMYP